MKKKAEFSKRERLLLSLVQKVKEFGIKNFGFRKTKNFKKFEEQPGSYNRLFYQKKDEVAFSYIDPILISRECKHGTLEKNLPLLREEGITPEEYDMYFFVTDGIEGESLITRQALGRSQEEFIELIFHEDAHCNLGLPLDMEEAAATLISYVATMIFLGADQKSIIFNLVRHPYSYSNTDNNINTCYKKLTELVSLYKNKEISLVDFLKIKNKIIYNSGAINTAEISFIHTYSHYFELLDDLLCTLDWDLKKFILTMRDLAEKYPKPTGHYGSAKYFTETRTREMQIENQIRKILAEYDVDE
ncbi:MAG: hypothetical protein UT05_C0001G0081 [Parcubacteria group bacterium GW2011_GWF2_38_76]|nr:MAG: hypothetical protein UT05_C0001G0081 [Parcubacteria group bacterium GW2011_GWF2_38_76]HBM45942.1 hypothetical protein [Patescibacteria group bacterium]